MKKSLSKILARMARDGDVETVAGIIEEMIEPEAAAEPAVPEKEAFPFEDVLPADPYRSDVEYVWENGIMNGFTDDDFAKLQKDLEAYKLNDYLAIFQKYLDAFYK